MKYEIRKFSSTGMLMGTEVREAKNHKEASRPYFFCRVKGKTVKRFDPFGKEVKEMPKVYKVWNNGFAILLMHGKYPEFVVYWYKETRDKAYEKCIEYLSAESAKKSPAQIDTIVYSGGIKGSRSGSTSKKTSSGYVVNATNLAEQILTPTGENSGNDKFDALAGGVWNNGFEDYHSKSKKKYFGKINIPRMPYRFFKEVNGKTIRMTNRLGGKYFYRNYCLSRDWVSQENLILQVKRDSNGLPAGYVGRFTKCNCGCGTYFNGRHYFKPSQLKIPGKKYKILEGVTRWYGFLDSMKEYIGTVITASWSDEDVVCSVENKYYWSKRYLQEVKREQDMETGRKENSRTSGRREGSDNREVPWKLPGYFTSQPLAGGKASKGISYLVVDGS